MDREPFPILEFDPTPRAVIEPGEHIERLDVPLHCVPCFFREVIEDLVARRLARQVACMHSELGDHPLYETAVDGKRLGVYLPGLSAPFAAGLLEEVIATGCTKFIACGGAGVLDKEIAVGHIVVPTAAVRDEGTSYHYLPPGREVAASPEAVAAIEGVLKARGIPYVVAKTWTTDAFYRETEEKVKLRRSEGCLTVEMEAAAFFAVAKFRGVTFGQILYGGDDVSGCDWDGRKWQGRRDIREALFRLAAEACLLL